MHNIFKLNPKLKTLAEILKSLKPGKYTLKELHKISGWKYKQSVHRALKKLDYQKAYDKNPLTNRIEVKYEINN